MEEDDRYTRITLRIPRELHARLDGEADRTSKSLNAEIISRLEGSFKVEEPVEVGSLANAIHELRADMQTQQQFIARLLKTGATVTTNESGQLVSVKKIYPPDLFSEGSGAVVELGFEPGELAPKKPDLIQKTRKAAKSIPVTVRGKPQVVTIPVQTAADFGVIPADVPTPVKRSAQERLSEAVNSPKSDRHRGSVKKVVLVGNIGREPVVTKPGAPKAPSNKGPLPPKGGRR